MGFLVGGEPDFVVEIGLLEDEAGTFLEIGEEAAGDAEVADEIGFETGDLVSVLERRGRVRTRNLEPKNTAHGAREGMRSRWISSVLSWTEKRERAVCARPASQTPVPDGHGADNGFHLILIVCRELSAKTDEPLFPRPR